MFEHAVASAPGRDREELRRGVLHNARRLPDGSWTWRYDELTAADFTPLWADVDTLPIPELLMCKAAGLTKRIRMGPAVKVIHLYHPVDTAIQAAVTDHVTGGRYMFGFGSGFPSPLFSEERGLPYDQRHPRLMEALDLTPRTPTVSINSWKWNMCLRPIRRRAARLIRRLATVDM